ncbi:hypothetical protein B296_00018888, partial [Ensete ventricosum]
YIASASRGTCEVGAFPASLLTISSRCGLAVSFSSAFHPAASVSGDCADFCVRGFRIRRSLTYSCSLLRCRYADGTSLAALIVCLLLSRASRSSRNSRFFTKNSMDSVYFAFFSCGYRLYL